MTNAWDDPRIARGMQKQLGQRRARIAAGEKPIGWKVGLGAKAAMERLHTKGLISDPVGKAKSVVFTDEGLRQSEASFRKLFTVGREA